MNSPENEASDKTLPADDTVARSRLQRLVEPDVLFTSIALLVLGVIWGTTLNLAENEQEAADRAAAALAADVADTYEAQVVRALREIDHTLKLVRHSLGDGSVDSVLQDLGSKALLPPGLLFTVSVTDGAGNVIATTHPSTTEKLGRFEFFQRARNDDEIVISRPRRDGNAGEWRLHFSRRLEEHRGRFAGIVTISVHAGYFVSGYEANVMGSRGVLGIVGTDGVFRAWRTGDDEYAGTKIDYQSLVPDDRAADAPAVVEMNSWDGVRRYTIARELFEFPLAIVVGLSETEQLAPAIRLERNYLWRAGAASVLLIAVVALLGRLSRQLQQARVRVMNERVAHARRIEYLAYHDSLTELPNRAFFSRLLSQKMLQARRYGGRLALLFLDLDRFKNINDSLGHEAGDELLQEVGLRLRGAVRKSDIVSRLGGDEFVVLLPEVCEETGVGPVAEKILSMVNKPVTIFGQEFRVTVSIGITIFPDDGEDEQTLMKNADITMYHAKEQGKNNFQFYSEKLNIDSLERLTLESSFRNALERSEFILYYQAKRSMMSGRVSGVEALLRWKHPDIGLIAPIQFITLAEETGLIVPLGRWVLRTACGQSAAWQALGCPPLTMAVNLSARQFLDEGLLEDVNQALQESGMDPRLLELEITETMIMHDMTQAIEILKDLKQMGVRVAIDDFGTGYSSLSTLKQFPLDVIKIDSSFIHDVIRSPEDQSLTQAVIAVGKSLGFTVVAEGVETADQVEFLRSHECDEFQGFYINEPMSAEDFVRFACEPVSGEPAGRAGYGRKGSRRAAAGPASCGERGRWER